MKTAMEGNLGRVSKPVRQPIQSRSINTKEKVLEAALELFCEKGYYKTTTNEIAQRAHVSIGSLYSYFADKDTIFLEILDRYHDKFAIANRSALNDYKLLETDPKAWLRAIIESLIKVHEETKELNRELNVLSYYNPEVAEILEQNKGKTRRETVSLLAEQEGVAESDDAEAAAIVAFDLISSTVDHVVFGNSGIERERLIEKTVDIIYKYFLA